MAPHHRKAARAALTSNGCNHRPAGTSGGPRRPYGAVGGLCMSLGYVDTDRAFITLGRVYGSVRCLPPQTDKRLPAPVRRAPELVGAQRGLCFRQRRSGRSPKPSASASFHPSPGRHCFLLERWGWQESGYDGAAKPDTGNRQVFLRHDCAGEESHGARGSAHQPPARPRVLRPCFKHIGGAGTRSV